MFSNISRQAHHRANGEPIEQTDFSYNSNQQLIAAHLGRGQPQQWLYDNALNLLSEGHIHSTKGMGVKAEQQGGRVIKSRANRYRYDPCDRLIEKTVNRLGFRPSAGNTAGPATTASPIATPPTTNTGATSTTTFGRCTRKFNFSHSHKRGTHYAHSEQHIIGEEYLWSGEQLLEAATYLN